MKRNFLFLIISVMFVVFLASCEYTETETPPIATEETAEATTEEAITYESAFDYVKQAEENIINSNKYNGTNKYGESAIEKIIYSDEYSALYCSIWSALEEIGTEGDTRFEKSKLRWQIDFTNEEWKNRLINAYKENGKEAFFSEYANIYTEEVLPAVEKVWKAEQ